MKKFLSKCVTKSFAAFLEHAVGHYMCSILVDATFLKAERTLSPFIFHESIYFWYALRRKWTFCSKNVTFYCHLLTRTKGMKRMYLILPNYLSLEKNALMTWLKWINRWNIKCKSITPTQSRSFVTETFIRCWITVTEYNVISWSNYAGYVYACVAKTSMNS